MLTHTAVAQSSETPGQSVPQPGEPWDRSVPAFRHRALLGLSYGLVDVSTRVSEASVVERDDGVTFGFESGLEERFTRFFSLAARARFSTANGERAETVGYRRSRWDFGLEPRLWVRPPRSSRIEVYLGLGSGVSLGSQTPPPRRAYEERIDGSPGYFLSACLGGTYSWQNIALFTELGYTFHSTHFETTLEPRAPGVPRVVEDRDYVDHALLISFGVVAGFGEFEPSN